MVQSSWTVQHAASLKALRQAAGLDVSVLAKRNHLSVNQVRQLEEGGDSAFYSPQIKLAVGRKLTLFLGGEFFEHPNEKDPSPMTASADRPADHGASAQPAMKAIEAFDPGTDVPPDKSAAPPRSPQRAGGLWVTSIAVGVVSALGLFWLLKDQETSARQTSLAAPEGVQATERLVPSQDPKTAALTSTSHTDAASPLERAQDSAPVAPSATAPSEASALTAALPLEQDVCRWSRQAPNLTPEGGPRPDNYVHVVALETTTVCWRDADQKSRMQTLQPQDQVSFWGHPPFQVYASHPGALKVYFKGLIVRWPMESSTQHIVLGKPHVSAD